MSALTDAVKRYYHRDKIRFWLLLWSLVVLLGQFVCTLLILIEESIIVEAISHQKFTKADYAECQMYTTIDQNGTSSIDNFQRRVLFWAQLVSHTVANSQLLFTLSLAVRSIHLERAFRAHVLLVFPFSWTWACCITLVSWPLLPMMATESSKVVEKCEAARFLFVVGIWQLVGALVIYAMSFGGWRRHEKKVLMLVAKRRTQMSNSSDSTLADPRCRSRACTNNGSIDHLLSSAPKPVYYGESYEQGSHYSTSASPRLTHPTFGENMTENRQQSIGQNGDYEDQEVTLVAENDHIEAARF